ncbi:hypothetical protein [Oceanibaculum nanhaiense]|uniref:hypothetical protein n=1 Tax=Oceanibaculum nanhaiense TaxID=1909734 RepID=UPI003D2724BA
MSKADRPWMKFYPADWRSDPKLRICPLAARGLWIDMLALMHEASPYGHLLVAGQPVTDDELAALVGAPSDLVSDCLRKLETAGVFSRTRKGVIYSRRMVRDEKKAANARNNGKMGGNPSLGKHSLNSASDKGGEKPPLKAQRPEARSQNISPSLRSGEDPPDQRPASGKPDLQVVTAGRGQRLPRDWVLPPDWERWAREAGLADPAREADKFKDYWVAKAGAGGVKLDWQATWRTWVRRSLEDAARKPGRSGGHTSGSDERLVAGYAAAMARRVET